VGHLSVMWHNPLLSNRYLLLRKTSVQTVGVQLFIVPLTPFKIANTLNLQLYSTDLKGQYIISTAFYTIRNIISAFSPIANHQQSVSPHLRTETDRVSETSSFSFNYLESGRWTKSENPVIILIANFVLIFSHIYQL
jgi:hypothetical protein